MEVMEVMNGFDSYIALLCFCLGAAVRAHFVHGGLSACKKMGRVTSHDQQTYLNEERGDTKRPGKHERGAELPQVT
jgi:hypothetical protein